MTVRSIALWILTILLGLMMVASGLQKLVSPSWLEKFVEWGYPGSFVYVVGMVELMAGAGLMVPRLSSVCALILSVVLVGATTTHLMDVGYAVSTLVIHLPLVSLYLAIAYIRRPDHLRRPATE